MTNQIRRDLIGRDNSRTRKLEHFSENIKLKKKTQTKF